MGHACSLVHNDLRNWPAQSLQQKILCSSLERKLATAGLAHSAIKTVFGEPYQQPRFYKRNNCGPAYLLNKKRKRRLKPQTLTSVNNAARPSCLTLSTANSVALGCTLKLSPRHRAFRRTHLLRHIEYR